MAMEKLRSLKCFPEVDKRVKGGIRIEDIAAWIQEDQKEYVEIKRESLIRQLYRYKDRVPANQLAIPEAKHIHDKLQEFAGDVNEVDMLQRLFYIQMDRIMGFREIERQTRFPMKAMYKEIEQAKDILVKLGELKIKLGLHGDDARTARFHVTGDVTKRVEEMPVDARERLGSMADKLLKALMAGETTKEAVVEAEWEMVPAPLEQSGDVENSADVEE